jgi:hypothetical protein
MTREQMAEAISETRDLLARLEEGTLEPGRQAAGSEASSGVWLSFLINLRISCARIFWSLRPLSDCLIVECQVGQCS